MNEASHAFGSVYFTAYVHIPMTHPILKNKDDINELRCFGGVTYQAPYNEKLYRIGFDTLHGYGMNYPETVNNLRHLTIQLVNYKVSVPWEKEGF